MVGREDELRRLAQLVAMPTTGVAMLAGEPGRLVRGYARRAHPEYRQRAEW